MGGTFIFLVHPVTGLKFFLSCPGLYFRLWLYDIDRCGASQISGETLIVVTQAGSSLPATLGQLWKFEKVCVCVGGVTQLVNRNQLKPALTIHAEKSKLI